eukprot:15477144-Alexandrium_andersonii.AAC.1
MRIIIKRMRNKAACTRDKQLHTKAACIIRQHAPGTSSFIRQHAPGTSSFTRDKQHAPPTTALKAHA